MKGAFLYVSLFCHLLFQPEAFFTVGLSVTLSKAGGRMVLGVVETGDGPLDLSGATQRAVAF